MEALPAFHNEPYTDFSAPANARAKHEALAAVRGQLGREYDLLISGERIRTGDLLRSVNPSNPREVVGVHHRATAELARRAVDSAYSYFPDWSATPDEERVRYACCAPAIHPRPQAGVRCLAGVRSRQDLAGSGSRCLGSHRFLRILRARNGAPERSASPAVQLPGERDEMLYLPLGVGVVIPPWNFPLAILAG